MRTCAGGRVLGVKRWGPAEVMNEVPIEVDDPQNRKKMWFLLGAKWACRAVYN